MLRSAWDIVSSAVNEQIRKKAHAQILLQSKIDSPVAFCIVHWNAPDFLLLTVSQIELLYPNSKIYILDNGSLKIHLTSIKAALRKFNNITLLALFGCPKWARKFRLNTVFDWNSHTAGLQLLLNYSAKQSDEIDVFLDQDCILSKRIDELFSKFSKDVILIGARDRWRGHASYYLIHPSFMLLQPRRINQLFGDSSFYDKRTESLPLYARDPYHGISFKALGRMLYLESRMHDKIPLLTSYEYNKTIYAWHAWYSSRTIGVNSNASIDGHPVSWLEKVRKIEYDFMIQVHRNANAELEHYNK